MCDFAAGCIQDDKLLILLIELKSGAADRGAIEQLQAGLDLIRQTNATSRSNTSNIWPEACLVADKQTAQLKRLLSSTGAHLRFGQTKLAVQTRKCGATLEVGD